VIECDRRQKGSGTSDQYIALLLLHTSIGIGIGYSIAIARGQYYWILDLIGCLVWYRSKPNLSTFQQRVSGLQKGQNQHNNYNKFSFRD